MRALEVTSSGRIQEFISVNNQCPAPRPIALVKSIQQVRTVHTPKLTTTVGRIPTRINLAPIYRASSYRTVRNAPRNTAALLVPRLGGVSQKVASCLYGVYIFIDLTRAKEAGGLHVWLGHEAHGIETGNPTVDLPA